MRIGILTAGRYIFTSVKETEIEEVRRTHRVDGFGAGTPWMDTADDQRQLKAILEADGPE
jgi:hypothetical protein